MVMGCRLIGYLPVMVFLDLVRCCSLSCVRRSFFAIYSGGAFVDGFGGGGG